MQRAKEGADESVHETPCSIYVDFHLKLTRGFHPILTRVNRVQYT
jgi:hypothetical protein